MAQIFDAASRLAEGRPAVDAIQDYVWACHLLGYQDSDLTLNVSQVRDWYGSEDGIDLQALDADCAALRAAVTASEGALVRQDVQLASMAVAWHGPGAQASRDFLHRHGEASRAVVAAVRTAAESLASLRDRLWHSIDGKVDATLAAEGRGAHQEWRAAAQTVTTGAGDRVTASELVDQEVKPFVDNDIRTEWLGAMRSAMAAVTEAYDAAAAELASEVAVTFDVPGELGPSWSPPPSERVATTPAGTGPVAGPVAGQVGAAAPFQSAWSAPSAPPASLSAPAPSGPAEQMAPPAPPVDPAAMAPPSMPSMPSMGGGMPDVGSGLSGFGGQLGDLLGGLMGTSQDALSDLPEVDEPDELDEPDDLDPLEDEDKLDDDDEGEEEADDEEEAEAESDEAAESEPVTEAAGPPEEQPAEPLSADAEPTPPPTAAPPPLEPLAAPAPAAGTPCEIAANELPQVGE